MQLDQEILFILVDLLCDIDINGVEMGLDLIICVTELKTAKLNEKRVFALRDWQLQVTGVELEHDLEVVAQATFGVLEALVHVLSSRTSPSSVREQSWSRLDDYVFQCDHILENLKTGQRLEDE